MTAAWTLFFVSCAMQGVGFALLNAALSAYRRNRKKSRGKVWELDGTTRDLDSSPAAADATVKTTQPEKTAAFPRSACLLLFGGALLMLLYAFMLSHLLLLIGQAIFTVFMGIAVYKQYTLMRGD